MNKTIYVNCPFCESLLEVDVASGKVVEKWVNSKKNESEDKMSSALKKLEEAKKRRQDLFQLKKEELKGQKEKTAKDFEKEVQRVKDEGVDERPLRPLDLD